MKHSTALHSAAQRCSVLHSAAQCRSVPLSAAQCAGAAQRLSPRWSERCSIDPRPPGRRQIRPGASPLTDTDSHLLASSPSPIEEAQPRGAAPPRGRPRPPRRRSAGKWHIQPTHVWKREPLSSPSCFIAFFQSIAGDLWTQTALCTADINIDPFSFFFSTFSISKKWKSLRTLSFINDTFSSHCHFGSMNLLKACQCQPLSVLEIFQIIQ